MNRPSALSRRKFLRLGAAAAASAVFWPRKLAASRASNAASQFWPLNNGWLFGGKFTETAFAPSFNDTAFSKVTLPHCVTRLSWQNWDPDSWEDVWIYRRHFSLPREARGKRIFLHFDGVMVKSTPVINGHALPQHLGGYLPSRYEITDWLADGDNVLAVQVDSRFDSVPPDGSPKGPKGVDYLEAGGIFRPVRLQAVPPVFISDVFAKPVDVLGPGRRIDVTCAIDAAAHPDKPMQLRLELRDARRVLSTAQQDVLMHAAGQIEVAATLSNLGNAALWDVDSPRLYEVAAQLLVDGKVSHECSVRIGLREARFEVDGFFLNGRRLQLFGLDRHEIYPYAGGAMPARVLHRDARILRRDFNCNIVRCSHYPQSEAFLDACDELGLMVWEETPGWGFLGDDAWKELVVQNVHDMILRDRNHPAIVIWGVRVNESKNDVPLYERTTALAKTLDGSRATSGSMTGGSRKNWKTDWHEDVFAFDDYHAEPDGSVGIEKPTPGVPYMLAEVVGQFNYTAKKGFTAKYRRAGEIEVQTQQALRHAQAHDRAAAYPHCSGAIGWCAFDYASLLNAFDGVKRPGVADVFRIPKLGASFYQAQTGPNSRPVILPNFYWDFGPKTPRGPGQGASIFSNCDELEVFVDGRLLATLQPDSKNYRHLKHPPFFADLAMDGAGKPELRIDGYIGGKKALSRSFSSDPAHDQFFLQADDEGLTGDGADATRLVFGQVDKFGAARAFASGTVSFQIGGPGQIVGDNPFALAGSGGMGAVWIRTLASQYGRIRVAATHSFFGGKTVKIKVTR
ncbi:MAG TPA: glycoside hydrolase family 2 TIM barrel-domain containing protein [Verrucomicrobiae bacterium]